MVHIKRTLQNISLKSLYLDILDGWFINYSTYDNHCIIHIYHNGFMTGLPWSKLILNTLSKWRGEQFFSSGGFRGEWAKFYRGASLAFFPVRISRRQVIEDMKTWRGRRWQNFFPSFLFSYFFHREYTWKFPPSVFICITEALVSNLGSELENCKSLMELGSFLKDCLDR